MKYKRKFGGKKYVLYRSFPTKTGAIREANKIRKESRPGFHVRIVLMSTISSVYGVYVRDDEKKAWEK
jgi:hypothetical protein